MSKKKTLIYLGGSLLSLIVLASTAFAINNIADGYRIVSGAAAVKVDVQGTCKSVSCTGGQDVFVPTNSENEWNLFQQNKPSYVSLEDCCAPESVLTQSIACPTGQTGGPLTQTRTSTCPEGATVPVTSDWITTSGACSASKTVPSAPINVTAVEGDGKVTLSFSPPMSDGGSSISSYKVSVYVNGLYKRIEKSGFSPITITGLPNYEPERFEVYAINAQGQSPGAYINAKATPKWTGELGTTNVSGTATNKCKSYGYRLPSYADFQSANYNGVSFRNNVEYWTGTASYPGVMVAVRTSAGAITGYGVNAFNYGNQVVIRCVY